MQAIGFYLVLPFLYLFSLLPLPILYLLSNVIFLILYYIIGYRKKIVYENLRKSFPEKSEKGILLLRKKFYKHLADIFVETLKTLSISKSTMRKHCSMDEKTITLMQRLYSEKKNCILVLGHLGNWEWASNAYRLTCKQSLYGIYHPLSNPYFNKLIYYMRTRLGTRLFEMKNTFRDMLSMKNENAATHAIAFIADQTPPPDGAYWTTFMNRHTPVFQGTEKIARKLNYPIVFMTIHKIKRGYYQIGSELLCENPSLTSDGEITEMHTRKLENEIHNQPECWLWSHRRWKHKYPY